MAAWRWETPNAGIWNSRPVPDDSLLLGFRLQVYRTQFFGHRLTLRRPE